MVHARWRLHRSAFEPGTCAVCGWRGIVGVVCRNRTCAGRFFYDAERNIVRGKVKIKESKAQKALFLDIRRWCHGMDVVQEVIFPWSIGPKGAGYRFDIVVPELNLIVEYDSVIHSKFNKMFHKNMKGFISQQMRDQIKDRMADGAGWKVIRVVEGDPEGGLGVRRYIEQHGR